MLVVFWILTPVEDGDSMFLRTAGIYLQVHMALQPTRTTWTEMIHDRFYVINSFQNAVILLMQMDCWMVGPTDMHGKT
jgi:hypothetical protein